MDLGFVLSLVVLLGGIWVYLHTLIREMTVDSPSANPLFFYGGSHWVVTVYLGLALAALYQLGTVDPAQKAPLNWTSVALAHTWPAALLISVLPVVSAKAAADGSRTFETLQAIFAVVIAASAIWVGVDHAIGISALALIAIVFTVALFGSTAYILFMSEVCADVRIETDKAFYAAEDDLLVSVRAAGYIVRPTLVELVVGSFKHPLVFDTTIRVPHKDRIGDGLIAVAFKSPVSSANRKAYYQVKALQIE